MERCSKQVFGERDEKLNHRPDKWTKKHSLKVGESKISENFQWRRKPSDV
jgi:hypothetical protein